MNRLKLFISNRHNDERGVTLIVVAICMSLLFPIAVAFSVELGQDTVVNRSLQGAADAGALDAAQYLSVSTANVQSHGVAGITSNYSGATSTITEGMWSGSSFSASSTCEASNSCNAVMATAGSSVQHLFEAGGNSLSRSAVAANIPAGAGFSIGTDLASFSSQTSVLNSLLNPLTGSGGVNISAAGYQGLADTSVSLLQLINASGSVLNSSNVLTTSISDSQLASFLQIALNAQPATTAITNALNALTDLVPLSSTTTMITLCQLISINGSTCSSGTVSSSALLASGNVFQMLTYAADVADGTSAVDLGAGLVTGVADAKVTFQAIQPAQIAYGPVGTSVTTGQIKETLVLSLVGGLVSLSIPLTGATGAATLHSIGCPGNPPSSVVLSPISSNAVSNTVNVLLASIPVATLSLNVSGVSATALTFNPAYGASNEQTVGTNAPVVSLGATNGLSLVNALVVNPILNPVLSLLTPVLAPLLQDLGVTVAGATVGVMSATCGGAQLVQ